MTRFRDPVTHTPVTQEEARQKQEYWGTASAALIEALVRSTPQVEQICQRIHAFLDQESCGKWGEPPRVPLCAHAFDSYITDHALITSAVAYCLTYDELDEDDRQLLRLAALSHEFPAPVQKDLKACLDETLQERLEEAWWSIAAQEQILEMVLRDTGPEDAGTVLDSLTPFLEQQPDLPQGRFLTALYYGHLVASERLFNHAFENADRELVRTIRGKADMERHPLAQLEDRVALVYGGATKIKGYVFEAAHLPEIRGASALFDRINRLDLPALFGYQPPEPEQQDFLTPTSYERGKKLHEEQRTRCGEVRAAFARLTDGLPVPLAPECVLYASGGNILALVPKALAKPIANAIEWLYNTETLVGNSSSVSREVSLLELQYGWKPLEFWYEDYAQGLHGSQKASLEAYYDFPVELRPRTEDGLFYQRKTFGELAALLFEDMMRRRAGWGRNPDRTWRHIPHFELLPYAVKCYSCDTRPAVVAPSVTADVVAPIGLSPKVFCEACARKRVVGQIVKFDIGGRKIQWFRDAFGDPPKGMPPWGSEFGKYLAWDEDNCATYYRRLSGEVKQMLKDLAETLDEKTCEELEGVAEQDALKELLGHLDKLQYQAEKTGVLGTDIYLPANDMAEIGHASDPSRYVGLIYADGNDIGAQVARIPTPAGYRQFSARLFGATQAAVFRALATHLTPVYLQESMDPVERPDRAHMWIDPFEVLTIGGDDLMLIVPGNAALPVALQIGQRLQELLGNRGETETTDRYEYERYRRYAVNGRRPEAQTDERPYQINVSLSAGVVVGAENTPVLFLQDLAEQLIKSAKKERKTKQDRLRRLERRQGKALTYREGMVDFQVLRAVGMVTSRLDTFREQAYRLEDEQSRRELTARPYSLVELEGLLEMARTLHGIEFPRSQLYQLRENLYAGVAPAIVNYMYFWSRLRELEHQRSLFQHFHQAWHGEGHNPPWRTLVAETDGGKKYYETIWHDLVEIYEFLKPESADAEEDDDAAI